MQAHKILLDERKRGIRNGLYHSSQILFAYNSNHIEGSQLSEEQTRHIYERGELIYDGQRSANINDIIETINHFKAFDFVLTHFKEPLSPSLVKELHSILKSGTSDSVVGEYKKRPNFVSNIKTARPSAVPRLVDELLAEYEGLEKYDIRTMAEFHVGFERIHPFEDGNGRVGRLLLFKECLRQHIVPFIVDEYHKAYYYRGLKEWDNQQGFLVETFGSCQDEYKERLSLYQDVDFKTKEKESHISI